MELWADESGEPTFTNMLRPLFIFGTMVSRDVNLAHELLTLRIRLTQRGYDLPDGFHSITNPPEVRTKLINVLSQRDVQAYATVIDKTRVETQYRDPDQFYWWAWYQHHKYFLPQLLPKDAKAAATFMAIATYGTDAQRIHLEKALKAGLAKSVPEPANRPILAYWPAATHPCLQAADAIVWAIQRAETQADTTYRDTLRRQIVEVRRIV
jgi:hypothetical protein